MKYVLEKNETILNTDGNGNFWHEADPWQCSCYLAMDETFLSVFFSFFETVIP